MTTPNPTDADTTATWPFWAPSRQESVREALALADVGRDDRFVDLGCGDGSVLVAASERSMRLRGVEADAGLADEARSNLAESGVDAEIVTGDLFSPDLFGPGTGLAAGLAADVVFTYLAPATLQRLLPELRAQRGLRVVTVDFDIPGLVPDRRGDTAQLYRMPGRSRRPGENGWTTAGTFVATLADCHSLSCLDAVHPGGDVRLTVTPKLGAVVSALAGADHLGERAALAVDLRWEPVDAGTFTGGRLRMPGVGDHDVFVLFTEDEEGMWDLSDGGVTNLRRALRRRARPTSVDEVLAAAEA